MAVNIKYDDLSKLRIDRSQKEPDEAPKWSQRFILIGIGVLVLLGIIAIIVRLSSSSAPEVQVVRATTVNSTMSGDTVLAATGYIVAHHKISVNSKVTGRVAWIGVEKGDKVKEGQVLVRLEDEEFRAQTQQAQGAMDAAKARLAALENGSRPEEIARSQHDFEQAKAQ